MGKKIEELVIDGCVYVPKQSINKEAECLNGMRYVIIRTISAGVFAGYLYKSEGSDVILKKSRRLWYWKGAASLSQLAMEGVKKPDECKFPCEIEYHELKQVIEIINCTQKAKDSISSVVVWSS